MPLVPASPSVPAPLAAAAKDYARASKAENTRIAYRADWARFSTWCEAHGLQALPAAPETVALYLTHRAEQGRRVSTIERELAAISVAHKTGGLDSPRGSAPVTAVMRGIRRTHGAPPKKKRPISVEELRRMVASLPTDLQGRRDRAILLLGFAGAFRRSELVSLDVGDLSLDARGLTVTLRRSKTDQSGRGRRIGIPFGSNPTTCPIRAVQDWLVASGITAGPLFPSRRTGRRFPARGVADLVKRAATAIGLDPSQVAGHSLRSGFATAAAQAGKTEHAIAAQTGHRSLTILRGYVQHGSLFTDNAAGGLGL